MLLSSIGPYFPFSNTKGTIYYDWALKQQAVVHPVCYTRDPKNPSKRQSCDITWSPNNDVFTIFRESRGRRIVINNQKASRSKVHSSKRK